jgi:hypothetical protein
MSHNEMYMISSFDIYTGKMLKYQHSKSSIDDISTIMYKQFKEKSERRLG